jgi:hypothetical protein
VYGAHPGRYSEIHISIPELFYKQTLYAHSAMGSPTNADRTNQPDGGSALAVGCTRRPASGPALRRERKGRELGAVLVVEGWCLALRRRAQARDVIDVNIDARTKRRTTLSTSHLQYDVHLQLCHHGATNLAGQTLTFRPT